MAMTGSHGPGASDSFGRWGRHRCPKLSEAQLIDKAWLICQNQPHRTVRTDWEPTFSLFSFLFVLLCDFQQKKRRRKKKEEEKRKRKVEAETVRTVRNLAPRRISLCPAMPYVSDGFGQRCRPHCPKPSDKTCMMEAGAPVPGADARSSIGWCRIDTIAPVASPCGPTRKQDGETPEPGASAAQGTPATCPETRCRMTVAGGRNERQVRVPLPRTGSVARGETIQGHRRSRDSPPAACPDARSSGQLPEMETEVRHRIPKRESDGRGQDTRCRLRGRQRAFLR